MKSKLLFRRLFAWLLACALALTLALPGAVWAVGDDAEPAAEAETESVDTQTASETTEEAVEETVHIGSTEEFLEFAENCTLDSWSQGKRFILDCDLSLEDTDFEPIPVFGGTFIGGSHTIRGLSISDSASPTGLFCVLQKGGVIRNLNVEGAVAPGGDTQSIGGIVGENYGVITGCSFSGTVSGKRNVGGIAGQNNASGVIRSCKASGALFGENRNGGIAGCNLGLIASCRNHMYVNIESVDPSIDLSSLNLDFSLDLAHLTQMDTANVATDSGGIAGYSSGTIFSCTNDAAIGHEHIGYNVGGIAGRSCGQIRECSNEGAVSGRKDVGGIVGQMEPYIQMQLSESTMNKLETQLNELSELVNQAADHAEGSAGGVGARLNGISGYVNSAMQEAENLRLTADIGTTVRGDAAGSSTTNIGAALDGTADANHNGGSLTISGNDDGSVTIGREPGNLDVDFSDVSLDGIIDRVGEASGGLDATTQIVAAPELGGLSSAVSGIGSQLSLLSGAMSGAVGTAAEDVRKINAKFSELSDTIFDAVSEAEQGTSNIITDASATDVDAITLGKTYGCTSSGAVYGDINSGGIAGSMAIEYALDPEDDVSGDLSGGYRRQYEYKAVLQSCVSTSGVTSKRSYAGAICGRMDLGLITDCEGYGKVASESGSYVGGIAGVSAGTVRYCFAKTALSGQKYVGGIVGSGVEQDASGDGSLVAGCYAEPEISGCHQYAGAISGADAGTFLENYYLSDTLAGINRQSYAGKAEPVSFEELSRLEDLPEAMRVFTLSFVADDEVVFSMQFSYGDSFDADDFPSLPQKEGCIASWDRTDLQQLHFDTTVTAVYTPYNPGIASAAVREDGRAILMAEGTFREDDTITITSEALTPTAFHIRSGSLGNRISGYCSTFGTSDFSIMQMNWDDVEHWLVELPDDGAKTHTLRYLPPDGESAHLRLYVSHDGVWEQTDFTTFGSYMTFDVAGTSARIAVVRSVTIWWVWALLVLLLAGLTVFVILLIRKLIKRAKRSAAQPKEAPEEEPEETAEAAAQPLAAESTPADAALLERARSAEERLARAEEELRLLREGGGTAVAVKPKKKFRWWIVAIVAAVLLAAAAAVFFLRSDVRTGLQAYRVIHAEAQRESLSMRLTAELTSDDSQLHTEAFVTTVNVDGKQVACVDLDGVQLYYANDTVYLENGRAFLTGGMCPDYTALLPKAAELSRTVEVSSQKSGAESIYSFSVSGEDAQSLLEILLPDAEGYGLSLSELELDAVEKDGALSALRFRSEASDLTLTAEAAFQSAGAGQELPEAVRSAVLTGKTEGAATLSADGFELLKAWAELEGKESWSADLTLSADCGPVLVSDTLRLDRQKVSGQSISKISKNASSIYFSGEKLCDEAGRAVTTNAQSLFDSAKVLELAYQIMLNGSAECKRIEDRAVYTLALDEDAMEQIAYTIAPDLKSQSVTLTDGTLEAEMCGGSLTELRISCSGALHVVLTDVSASVGARIVFSEREVSMPKAVLDALKK